MKNEKGIELSDKELIKESLDQLANVLCFLYETNSDTGHALAFMVDSAIKYGQCIYRDDDVLSASADYVAYEQEYSERMLAKAKG